MPSKYVKIGHRSPKVASANRRNARRNAARYRFNGVGPKAPGTANARPPQAESGSPEAK
jgi:hypothetical protein